jgi:hypothetical protein
MFVGVAFCCCSLLCSGNRDWVGTECSSFSGCKNGMCLSHSKVFHSSFLFLGVGLVRWLVKGGTG